MLLKFSYLYLWLTKKSLSEKICSLFGHLKGEEDKYYKDMYFCKRCCCTVRW